jgi:nucleoside-diphosphate-sugar epimerase
MEGALIIGCGYAGLAIARRLAERGEAVYGTTRSDARMAEIRAIGALPLRYDAGRGELPKALHERVDSVVITAGPSLQTGEDPTPGLLDALAGFSLRRLVYLSSTSVYGDCEGRVVDEETPCAPASPAGERRLAIERLLLERHERDGLPAVILRLPAIYGPGRDGLAGRIRAGRFRVVGDGASFGNRIHVHDLATAAVAALENAPPGRVYVVSDDEPAPRGEVADYVADLIAAPRPPRVPVEEARATMDPSVFAMFADSKRLSNERMKRELGVELAYPTYREGFRAILGL